MGASLGHELRQWRSERGLNQSAAAETFGLTQSYYSKIERGTHTPSTEVLARMAEIVGFSLDDTVLSVGEPRRTYEGGGIRRLAPVGIQIAGVNTQPGDVITLDPDIEPTDGDAVLVRIDGEEWMGVIARHPGLGELAFWPFGARTFAAMDDVVVLGVATALSRPLRTAS